MKKALYLFALALMTVFASCDKEENNNAPQLQDVTIQLQLAEDNDQLVLDKVNVILTSGETVFQGETGPEGVVTFKVPAGIYSINASSRQSVGITYFALNATKEGIVVDNNWIADKPVFLDLVASKSNQLIIKELYTGGSTNPNDGDTEAWDSYVTLYNNSPVPATVKNLCLGTSQGNAYAGMLGFFGPDGNLVYEKEDWIPATHGIWYFPNELTIEPYSEVVVCIYGAIDHTLTNPNAVDMSHADYTCYDPECGYNHEFYYPAPSENIPSSHYLKGIEYGMGNGWMLSVSSPAFFIFTTGDQTPKDWCNGAMLVYPGGFEGIQAFAAKKLSRSAVIDGVDVWSLDYAGENYKRMTPDIDAGYIYHTIDQGYSIYRNVDQKATEAIEGNKEKLVYNYAMGTADIEHGSTDNSKIDAEASIKNGAKIVYMDTNNSTNDFHLRKQAAQKTR